MLTALIALGLLLIGVGFVGLVRPNAIQRWASMNPIGRYAMAVGVRLAFALFLFAVAPEARWPGPTRVFALIALAAAVGLLVMGPTRLGYLADWWSKKPAAMVRFVSALGIAAGVLLVVDAL